MAFFRTSKLRRTRASLGRDSSIVRLTWGAGEDVGEATPSRTVLATSRTASQAAALASSLASLAAAHGYEKATGAWWAKDEDGQHRFLIEKAEPKRGRALATLATATTCLALAGAFLAWKRRSQ